MKGEQGNCVPQKWKHWSQHEVILRTNMAEAKLVLRSGENFVFKNEDNAASFKTMKDLITSVRKIQSKVNDKLTEIVNDEKLKQNDTGLL